MAARQRLTAKFVAAVKEPGAYGDGGQGSHGLILRVRESKGGRVTKSWVQRVIIHGKPTNIGLGPTWLVTLGQAREKAIDNHRIARRGGDPRNAFSIPTFAEAVEQVIAMHSAGWKKGGRTAHAWRSQLARHAAPLADKRVDKITSGDVLGVLEPIWLTVPEIAKKQRHRINAVMKWSIAQGYREDNPAGEALSAVLPKQNGGKHHRAIPAQEVPDVIAAVHALTAWQGSKLAFEFLALTACRSGEVRLATWPEINRERRVWTIPADRTKTAIMHRVPLTDAALRVLDEAEQITDGRGLIFPSITGRVLNASTLSNMLLDLGADMVPHGLRSSFRSWAAEATDYPWVIDNEIRLIVQLSSEEAQPDPRSYWAVVDTGAQRTGITQRVVDDMGIHSFGTTMVQGIDGQPKPSPLYRLTVNVPITIPATRVFTDVPPDATVNFASGGMADVMLLSDWKDAPVVDERRADVLLGMGLLMHFHITMLGETFVLSN